MSFSINFSGHIQDAKKELDDEIIKLANYVHEELKKLGIFHYGSVGTPTGGNSLIHQPEAPVVAATTVTASPAATPSGTAVLG